MSTDTRKKLGKSCLVCRRRKVKCDKIKPICLACVKHQSTEDCKYEDRDNIRFFHMVYEQEHESASPGDKVSKTTGTKKQAMPKSNVVQDLNYLKDKLHSLEVMLKDSSPVTTSREVSSVMKKKSGLSMLSKFGAMSFHEDYGAIEVRAGRLTFAGPLHFIALSRRDPFTNVFITMLRKVRSQTHDEAMKGKFIAHNKYPYIKFSQDEIAFHLIYSSMDEEKADASSSRAQKDHKPDKRIKADLRESEGDDNACEQGRSGGGEENIDDSVELDKSHSNSSNMGENVEQKFKNKLIENEGLDEMRSIDQREEITHNPLSVVNLLNEENKIKKSLDNNPSNPMSNENGDLAIWRKLQALLNTLQQQQVEQQKKLLANQRIPDMLFGQLPSNNPSAECTVLSNIQKIIPSDKLIWIHIDNFFKSPLHGLFPVLNEDWFRDTITNFIGERKNVEKQPKITISKRFGFSNIGSLLIVLRLSFLMYPDKLESCSTDEERYVLAHPLGVEFINVAQMCLNLFKMLRKGVLPILHCALLLRIYKRFAPEEGDVADGGDTELFSGLLVRMATSIGLNTEAETSYQLSQSPWYLQAWRKCWYIIYFLDQYEAMNTGNTVIVDVDSFNTKLPTIDIDTNGEYPSYVTNPGLEIASINCFRKKFEFSLRCRKLIKIVVNKRAKTSCEDVQNAINEVESYLKDNYGEDLKAIISQPCNSIGESINKCNNFTTFIETMSFLTMCYFHLFLNVDKLVAESPELYDSRVSFFYLKKLLNLYVQVEPVMILLYYTKRPMKDNKDIFVSIFGRNSKLLIVQSCGMFIARFPTILLCLLSRLEHLKFNYLNNEEKHKMFKHSEHLKDLPKMVDVILKITLDKFASSSSITQLLSGTYFYAWRVFKGKSYIYKLIKNQENNLYDLKSELNQQHVMLATRNLETGEPMLQDALNPLYAIPKYNTMLLADLSDFGEILSILSSTKWDTFSPYFSEYQLRVARDYRTSPFDKAKQGNKPEKPSAKANPDRKDSGLPEIYSKPQGLGVHEGFRNDSPRSALSGTATVSNPEDSGDLHDPCRLDEVDAFWYSTMLRNANGNANWSPSSTNSLASYPQNGEWEVNSIKSSALRNNDDSSAKDQSTGEKIVNDEISNGNVGLDELFNNQALLQEHVIQQLQQLTSRQATINDQHSRKNIANAFAIPKVGSPKDKTYGKDSAVAIDPEIASLPGFDNFDLLFPISNVYGDDMELK